MGSRYNPKMYKRNTSSRREAMSSLRTQIKNSSQQPRARRGYGPAVPRAVGAAIAGEMKYFDSDRSATNINAVTTTYPAGAVMDPGTTINLGDAAVANPLCLFVPKVSAALNGRIGRKVKVLKIRITGTIACGTQTAASAADPAARIRLSLVLDQQTNSAQMTPALLYNDGSSVDTTICSFQNPNNFGRFKVLKEKTIKLGNLSMAGAGPASIDQAGDKRPFKMSIAFKEPVLVNFNATNGGTVADIIDNSFHIVCATDSVNLVPTLSYYCRVCYKE